MKRFTFSLQRLLGYKEQLFNSEKAVLVEMRAVLAGMVRELEDIRHNHRRSSDRLSAELAGGLTAGELEMHKTYLRVLEHGAEQKQKQIKLQQQAIDKQMDKVREAKIEISTMEKLKEKKLEEYNYFANKEQEQFIEEYVNTQRAMQVV